jgi:cysteine desulfurase
LTIYLDNLAATPVDPRVAERHCAAMTDHPGNAHSTEHSVGVQAQNAIDRAARSLLHTLGSEAEDVTFTPGASAALWIAVEDAIARVVGRPARIAATAVEHPALLAALRRAEREDRVRLIVIPVDETASPQPEAIEAALADGVDLLCTMAANNEVGTVTDLAAISAMVARYGSRHLVDASQAAGHIQMPDVAAADLIVVSGAKIYGPRRAGALIGSLGREAKSLAHDLFGSPDVPAAVALAFAMELRAAERTIDEARIAAMRDALQGQLVAAVPGIRVNGAVNARLAGSLHVSTPHIPGEAAVNRLWGRVAVSTGAACRSGVPGSSHVLSAMNVPEWVREGAVRIGIGRFNTASEVEEAGELIAAALNASEPPRRRA